VPNERFMIITTCKTSQMWLGEQSSICVTSFNIGEPRETLKIVMRFIVENNELLCNEAPLAQW